MSRNGSGTYSLPAGNPVVTGTTISSTWANNTLSDIATALTQSIASDGQTTPTANLPMGTFRHTGVGAGNALTDYARYDQVQNSSAQWLTSVVGVDTITASATVIPAAYAAGQTFRFVSAGANTGAVTINISSLGAKSITKLGSTALSAGDISSGAIVTISYDGTQFQVDSVKRPLAHSGANSDITSLSGLTTALSIAQGGTGSKIGPVLRNYIQGYTLSTAGSSSTFSISDGQAADSTNTELIYLGGSLTKTTASWSAGSAAGGLDTGTIAASTWYHVYIIRRPDTGVCDALISLSASSPTLPTNYTQYRRIGSILTNGSSQWTKFFQKDDFFYWDVPVNNINATNPGTAAVTATLTVPTGVQVSALIPVRFQNGTSASAVLFLSDLSMTDTAPNSGAAFTVIGGAASGTSPSAAECIVVTNTSGQIRYRLSASGASDTVIIATKGWYDSRGRNA